MPLSRPGEDLQTASAFPGIWSRPYRVLTLGLVLIVSFVAFEALAVSTTLPAVVRDLGGLRLYGWAFSAFLLTNLIGIVVAGDHADRRGLTSPFLIGVALFVLGLVSAGTSPSMLMIVLSRAVQGFGAGMLSSLAFVCIARGYPEAAQPRILAVLSTAWVVPGLVGPALAGMIAQYVGWRWVFLALAPLPVIAAGLTLPALHSLQPALAHSSASGRTLPALRLAAGTGLFLAGLGSRSLMGLLLAAPGLGVTWFALQRLFPAGTLQARAGLPAAIATTGLLNLAFFGVDAFVPLSLTGVRGQSLTTAGLALTAATLTWTTGAWIQAHCAPRQSRRRLVQVGLLLIMLGILSIAGALFPAVPALLIVFAWGVAGLGMGIAYSTTKLTVLETTPAGQEGAIAAAIQLADVLGAAVGTGLGGVLVGFAGTSDKLPRGGLLSVDLLMTLVAGLTLITAGRLPERPPLAPVPTETLPSQAEED